MLFNGISTFLGNLMPKSILLEEQLGYDLTHNWDDKEVYNFPKGICQKVNVFARLEFELVYYDSVTQHFNHYAKKTFPK